MENNIMNSQNKGEREEAPQSDQCFPDNIFSNEALLKLFCYYVCIYRAVVMLKLCFMSILNLTCQYKTQFFST